MAGGIPAGVEVPAASRVRLDFMPDSVVLSDSGICIRLAKSASEGK